MAAGSNLRTEQTQPLVSAGGVGRRLVSVALAVALVVGIVVSASLPAAASDHAGDATRIIARKLTDGRVEFGLRHTDGTEQLPTPRLFPYRSAIEGRWYQSGPVSIGNADDVRIIARKLADGRIEFALSFFGSTWYPDARYFPYRTARVGRWLRSSAYGEVVASAPASTPASSGGTAPESAASRQNPPAAGTCARGGDGVTLYCTRQAGRATNRQELRPHLNAFVAMLHPHWPWIGVALESTGGWSFGSCGHPQAAGCYFPGQNRIVLADANLAGQPLWAIEETLIHEFAHAYDWALAPDDEPERQPSVRSMTAYPVEFRHELFADTLAVNVLGNRSSPVYFQESRRAFGLAYERWHGAGFTTLDRRSFDAAVDRIPAHPTAQDRRAVWQAVCGDCGTPVPAVVWTNADGAPEPEQGGRGAGLLIDFPQPPKIVVTISIPCSVRNATWPERPVTPDCRDDPDTLRSIERKRESMATTIRAWLAVAIFEKIRTCPHRGRLSGLDAHRAANAVSTDVLVGADGSTLNDAELDALAARILTSLEPRC